MQRRSLRVVIRGAVAGDAAAVAGLHQASIRALCSSSYAAPQIAAWAGLHTPLRYLGLIADASVEVLVEQGRDGLRGLGVASPGGGVINALYVDPAQTGRGTGLRLLRALEERLVAAGRDRAHLNATLNAVGFYEAAGYSNEGSTTNVLPSGLELPAVAMSRGL